MLLLMAWHGLPATPDLHLLEHGPVATWSGCMRIVALLTLLACAPPAATVNPAEATTWNVYDGEDIVLTVQNRPGVLLSVAHPPPGVPLPEHPFLNGASHSASHEHQLRQLLEASDDMDAFLAALDDAGFRLVVD